MCHDSQAPEKNPYRTANAVIPATSCAASMQKINMATVYVEKRNMFATPSLRSKKPGRRRPKHEDPFRMEILYEGKFGKHDSCSIMRTQ